MDKMETSNYRFKKNLTFIFKSASFKIPRSLVIFKIINFLSQDLAIIVMQILFFHKFVLFKHGCQNTYETCLSKMWDFIMDENPSPFFYVFFCMITMFEEYEPMKKWISYDYYCQTTQEFYDEVTNCNHICFFGIDFYSYLKYNVTIMLSVPPWWLPFFWCS